MSDVMVEPEVAPAGGAGSGNMGIVKGVPGRVVQNIGVLDLRGIKSEDLAQLQSLSNIGAVLIDDQQRNALSHVQVSNVGSISEVPADCRVMIEPLLEFSKATVEAMLPGQKFLLVGIILFKPDVPPAVVAEKFAELHIVGILLATPGVHGALFGRAHITGVSANLPEKDVPVVHNIGQNTVNSGYLSHLPDNALYINMGQTIIEANVTEELLAQKFWSYVNVGQTVAPQALLDLLRARCSTNMGNFAAAEELSTEAVDVAE